MIAAYSYGFFDISSWYLKPIYGKVYSEKEWKTVAFFKLLPFWVWEAITLIYCREKITEFSQNLNIVHIYSTE